MIGNDIIARAIRKELEFNLVACPHCKSRRWVELHQDFICLDCLKFFISKEPVDPSDLWDDHVLPGDTIVKHGKYKGLILPVNRRCFKRKF